MNSYHRTPNIPWKKIGIVSLCSLVLSLALFELILRWSGYSPNIEDDYDLWSLKRGDVNSNRSGKNLVLVGASRIKANISEQALLENYPGWNIVNLAIVGKHPMAVVEDLANDNAFIGTVILSVWPRSFLPEVYEDQRRFVDYYHEEWNQNRKLNKLIALRLQAYFSFLNSSSSTIALIRSFIKHGRLPRPDHVSTDKNRFQSIDFSKVDADLHRKHRESRVKTYYESNRIMDPDAWLTEVKKVVHLVDKIRARGGDVIFVRMPTTGKTIEYDQNYYPKKEYWDKLASLYDGQSIHFMDYPSLMAYDSPDTSHLDFTDRTGFTRDLVKIIRQLSGAVAE